MRASCAAIRRGNMQTRFTRHCTRDSRAHYYSGIVNISLIVEVHDLAQHDALDIYKRRKSGLSRRKMWSNVLERLF